jgi:hypothetical protein
LTDSVPRQTTNIVAGNEEETIAKKRKAEELSRTREVAREALACYC